MSKTYKLKWTSNAKEDLLNIVDFIKQDSLSAARKVYGQLKEKAQSSDFFPLRGSSSRTSQRRYNYLQRTDCTTLQNYV